MRALVAIALLAGGCLRSTEYHCTDNAQCSGGVCEPVGFCSFADGSCASGQRFGDSAGGYAGQCVDGSGGDGGVDAPPDDAMTDAPPDMVDMMVGCPTTYAAINGGQPGHVYRVITTNEDWDVQRAACAADGANAYLAIPDDMAEILAMDQQFQTDFWVGIHDMTTEGTYENVKGMAQTYLPWAAGQPNDFGDADCVEVRDGLRQINDTTCTSNQRALCECEP